MKIKFLGSGSAFVTSDVNFHSNVLVTFGAGYNLLVDAGTDIKEALRFHDISLKEIDGVVVTHAHADHVGGLEYIAFYSKFILDKKLDLFVPEEFKNILWDGTLKGGLGIVDGRNATLYDYFNVKHHSPLFSMNRTKHCSRTIRGCDDTFSEITTYLPAYSIVFEKMFFSGDTKEVQEDKMLLADIVFQDCEFASYPGSVHMQFKDLKNLPSGMKEKMWLYHYSGAPEQHEKKVLDAGFAGIVRRGQEFNI